MKIAYFSMLAWGEMLFLALITEGIYQASAHHAAVFCGFVIITHALFFLFKCIDWAVRRNHEKR